MTGVTQESWHFRAMHEGWVVISYVLGYKGKWGPFSQPCKLGDGVRLMAGSEYSTDSKTSGHANPNPLQ